MAFVALALLALPAGCRPTARQIAEDLSRATLYVESFDADGKPVSQGSAFFIAADTAITNMHVLRWAKTLRVSSPTRGVSFDVLSVVGVDFDRDLCVLRLSSREGAPLPFAEKGSVAVGDRVYVGGNPKGFVGTVSTGIVSGVRDDGRLIQIDAAISPGSSGGPVVNEGSRVIGVATLSVIDGQNLNFAVGLLGGVAARVVNWPVADVGKLALSDRDLMFLVGPVRLISETLEFPRKGRAMVERELVFDTNGMITTVRYGPTPQPDQIETREYFDARIPSFWDEALDYEAGRERRLRDLHFGETLNPFERHRGVVSRVPDVAVSYDAFGREKESHTRTPDGGADVQKAYDERGRLIRKSEQSVWYGQAVPLLVTEFQYVEDEKGNWIRRMERWGVDARGARVPAELSLYEIPQIARRIEYFTER